VGIAMLTADEASYAGAYQDVGIQGNNHYLNYNASVGSVYTMTPISYISGVGANVTRIVNKGAYPVKQNVGARPVLSLKSCVKYIGGSGIESDPYQVAIDETCESAEN